MKAEVVVSSTTSAGRRSAALVFFHVPPAAGAGSFPVQGSMTSAPAYPSRIAQSYKAHKHRDC